jgi:hypothetical protein
MERVNLRLGDGARAVGDGQSSSLSDRVGVASLSEGGGARAVGSVGSDDLGGGVVGAVAIGVGRHDRGGESNNSNGETHFDGFGWIFRVLKIVLLCRVVYKRRTTRKARVRDTD